MKILIESHVSYSCANSCASLKNASCFGNSQLKL